MVLQVSKLTKVFESSGCRQTAVDNISFSLNEGESIGLIGESGSGKSTTANLIAGLIAANGGSIILDGTELVGATGRQLKQARSSLQMVFQNPKESFDPKIKLKKAVAEPLIYKKQLDTEKMDALVGVAFDKVGLKREYLEKYAWEISGGECQRAAIARAIVASPKLVLCDEVTSALDVSVQAQIINLLHELKRSGKTSFLMISHDLAVVSSLCDHVAVMYKGSIMEYGSALDVINTPLHPYTQGLLKSAVAPGKEVIDKIREVQEPRCACKYYSYCPAATDICGASRPEETEVFGHKVLCHMAIASARKTAE